jgi:hypothetical protein
MHDITDFLESANAIQTIWFVIVNCTEKKSVNEPTNESVNEAEKTVDNVKEKNCGKKAEIGAANVNEKGFDDCECEEDCKRGTPENDFLDFLGRFGSQMGMVGGTGTWTGHWE